MVYEQMVSLELLHKCIPLDVVFVESAVVVGADEDVTERGGD